MIQLACQLSEKTNHVQFQGVMKIRGGRQKLATSPVAVANDIGDVAKGLGKRGCREKGAYGWVNWRGEEKRQKKASPQPGGGEAVGSP
jgi:hypothetical protein